MLQLGTAFQVECLNHFSEVAELSCTALSSPMLPASRAHLSLVPATAPRPLSDRDLVASLIAHEPTAPVLTWRKYAPRVFGMIQRTLGSASDAEDATQEVFLRLFSRIHTLRDPDALGAFVISVAIRVIRGHLRQRSARKTLHLVEDLPDIAVPGLDMEARSTLRRFYEVLDALPTDERLVLALRHLEGMTLTEVAAATGLSLSTAKRRLSRASARLAKRVANDPLLVRYSARIDRDVE
jgi:RNA polymerase sigma-70 factor, ECF subfamily